MKRTLLLLAAGPMMAGPADASALRYALDQIDGEAARLTLVDFDDADLTGDAVEGWRIGAKRPRGGEDAGRDVRLKVKVRPNRAMGRMSVAF